MSICYLIAQTKRTDKKEIAKTIRKGLNQGRRNVMVTFPAVEDHENHPVGEVLNSLYHEN